MGQKKDDNRDCSRTVEELAMEKQDWELNSERRRESEILEPRPWHMPQGAVPTQGKGVKDGLCSLSGRSGQRERASSRHVFSLFSTIGHIASTESTQRPVKLAVSVEATDDASNSADGVPASVGKGPLRSS